MSSFQDTVVEEVTSTENPNQIEEVAVPHQLVQQEDDEGEDIPPVITPTYQEPKSYYASQPTDHSATEKLEETPLTGSELDQNKLQIKEKPTSRLENFCYTCLQVREVALLDYE